MSLGPLARHGSLGRGSERLDPDQFELALEDIETEISSIEAEQDACGVTPLAPVRKPRATNQGSLPKHLPRIDVVIEPEEATCAGGDEVHVIGEDVSERLDVIPAQFRVIVTHRPKYGCRPCEGGVLQAPAPASVTDHFNALIRLGHKHALRHIPKPPSAKPRCPVEMGASSAAERGATAHEIIAILGHSTPEEAERYTREVNAAKLADSGFAKAFGKD